MQEYLFPAGRRVLAVFSFSFLGAYGSLTDAAIWWCLRTGGGGVLTSQIPEIITLPLRKFAPPQSSRNRRPPSKSCQDLSRNHLFTPNPDQVGSRRVHEDFPRVLNYDIQVETQNSRSITFRFYHLGVPQESKVDLHRLTWPIKM